MAEPTSAIGNLFSPANWHSGQGIADLSAGRIGSGLAKLGTSIPGWLVMSYLVSKLTPEITGTSPEIRQMQAQSSALTPEAIIMQQRADEIRQQRAAATLQANPVLAAQLQRELMAQKSRMTGQIAGDVIVGQQPQSFSDPVGLAQSFGR